MRKLIVITRGLEKEDYDFIQLIKKYLKTPEQKSKEMKIKFGANLSYSITPSIPTISFERKIKYGATPSTSI
ncbi:MAG: hypothetical protein QW047_08840 [Sulfolobales archaeon]